MAILTREQILQADDLKREMVEVPEWGGEVIVRCLTGTERDEFESALIQFKGQSYNIKLANARARLTSLSVVDEAGERLFSEADVVALGQKSAAALSRVFEAAQRLSGLKPKDMEELLKNSPSGQNGGSISA